MSALTSFRPARLVSLLATWTPTDEQLRYMEQLAIRVAGGFDSALKSAVILTVLYLAVEVGSAFLPGGAVSRVLGGVR